MSSERWRRQMMRPGRDERENRQKGNVANLGKRGDWETTVQLGTSAAAATTTTTAVLRFFLLLMFCWVNAGDHSELHFPSLSFRGCLTFCPLFSRFLLLMAGRMLQSSSIHSGAHLNVKTDGLFFFLFPFFFSSSSSSHTLSLYMNTQ